MATETDDKVLILVAASRLAHGDDDFIAHLVRKVTRKYHRDIGKELEHETWVLSPEIHREVNRIVELKMAKKIEIVGLRGSSAEFKSIPKRFLAPE
jgi:hypothetical protein